MLHDTLFALLLAAAPTTEVVVVGTYHFGNPGKDQHNVKAVDITTPERQRQLDAITTAPLGFKPTKVAVEWPAETTDERYGKYRAGTLPPSPNEVVQLGFRLAQAAKLERVHGIDADGDFPFGPVSDWAKANGRSDVLEAMSAEVGRKVAKISAMQEDHTIGGVLRWMNDPAYIRDDHRSYLGLLQFGAADEQPGAKLNAA